MPCVRHIEKITLSLDRGDICDRSNSLENTKGFTYENLVKWAKAGDTRAIYRVFYVPYNRPTPTKLPAGKIELFANMPEESCGFSLSMDTAECVVTNGDRFVRIYTHATSGVGLLKTNSETLCLEPIHPKFGKKTRLSSLLEKLPTKAGVSNLLKNVR